jgi:hypothetical protein
MNAHARLTMKVAVAVGVAVEGAVAVAVCLQFRGCSLRRAVARRLPLRIIKPSLRTIFSAMRLVLSVPVPVPGW